MLDEINKKNEDKLERRQSGKQIQGLIEGQAAIKAQLEPLKNVPIILAKLVATVDNLYDGCPHREAIARGANNIKRVEDLEKEYKTLNDKQHTDRLVTAKGLAKIALVVAAAGMAGANINLSGLLSIFG